MVVSQKLSHALLGISQLATGELQRSADVEVLVVISLLVLMDPASPVLHLTVRGLFAPILVRIVEQPSL